MKRFAAVATSVLIGSGPPAQQYALWQADVQIRSLSVSESGGNLTVRVVVATESGEALGARVEVLLPVGVGIVAVGEGCVPGPSRTGISALRARVECALGDLPARSSRALNVTTTMPPSGVRRGFAVVVMSDTPDPKPDNNFAERSIPPDGGMKRRS